MEDIAALGIAVDATQVEKGTASLDKLTDSGGKAESQVDKLIKKSVELGNASKALGVSVDEVDRRVESLRSSTDPLYAAQSRLNKELAEAKTLYKAGAIAAADYEKIHGVLEGKLNRVAMLQGKAANGAKLHSHEMLNLSRQFSDIGVTAAMGMNPIMIMIQQGPQLAETFAMASARGIGFTAVLKEFAAAAWGAVAPFAPFIAGAAAVAAVIGGGFLLATKEANRAAGDLTAGLNLTKDELKDLEEAGVSTKITFGDTFSAVFTVAGQRLAKAFEGPIKTVQGWFSALYQGIVKGAQWMAQAFTATVMAIGRIGKELFAGLSAAFRGDFEAAADHLTKSTSEVLAGTWQKAGELNADFWSDVVDTASEARKAIIEDELDRKEKAARKTGKSAAEKELDRRIKASQEFIKQLEKETATVGLDAIQKKEWEIANEAAIAPTLALAAAIREKGAALIEATKAAAVANMGRDADEEAKRIELERSLINATNREREIALALQSAEMELTRQHVDLQSEAAQAVLDKVKNNAAAQYDLNNELSSTLDKLKQIATLSGNAATSISQAAGGLAQAFGSVGTAIGGLISTYAELIARQDEYAAKMEELRVNGREDTAEYKVLVKSKADAERRATGQMITSAKSFFKEKSAGYKVIEAAEKAYRVFEFAMAAKSILTSGLETAQKIAGSAKRAVAYGAEAVVNALRSLPFPFNLAAGAATAAAVAAAGVALLGGGRGGGSAAPVPSAADVQESQGAGSVFGDPLAKSASLTNSLSMAEKYQNKDLEFSNSMASSLRSIDGKMSALAAAVARQIGVSGGMFDTSKLGLGTSGRKGVFGIGGGSTTNTLQDLGLQFGSQNIADIIAGGIQGNTYQTVQSVKTKNGIFGIGGGTKTSYNTVTGQISQEIKDSISEVVGSLRAGVLEAASALGLEGAESVIDAMNVALGSISFEGMSGSEIQETLNAVFGKLGDQMAEAVGGGLVEKFKQVGEGAFETLTRIATGIKVFDQQFELLGKTLDLTGIKAVEAKQGLIDLMGGLDPFLELTKQYAEDFLTEAERLAPVQKAVSLEMARLGLSAVTTKDQFKTLVSGIDANTEAGRQLFASLMKVAPAFAKVADAAEEAANAALAAAKSELDRLQGVEDQARQAMERARQNLIDGYLAEASALKSAVGRLQELGKTLREFVKGLFAGPLGFLSPEEQYKANKSLFDSTLAKARAGDEGAAGQLPQVAEAFLNASRDFFASSSGYYSDRDYVASAVDGIASYVEGQATAAQSELEALNNLMDGVDGVIDGIVKLGDVSLSLKDGVYAVDNSVKSVAEGIANFNEAMGAYTAAVSARLAQAEAMALAAQQAAAAAAAAQAAAAQQIADALANAANGGVPTGGGSGASGGTWADRYSEVAGERPDVIAEAERLLASADRNSPWFKQHGLDGGVNGFVDWWLNNKPANDTYAPDGRKAFAAGGVLDRPMTIGEAGIGGEAGPEGLLPLTRVGGKLGVSAAFDEETKQLLREIRDYLKGANAQRRDAALETLAKLETLIEANAELGREVARK